MTNGSKDKSLHDKNNKYENSGSRRSRRENQLVPAKIYGKFSRMSVWSSIGLGNISDAMESLRANPDQVNDQGKLGMTVAHVAVCYRNLKLLECVSEIKDFDPFIKDDFNRTALDCIFYPGMQEYRKLLMNRMYGVFPGQFSQPKLKK